MPKPKRRITYVIHHVDHVIEKTYKNGGSSSRNFSIARTFRQAIRKAQNKIGEVEIERIYHTGKHKGLCKVFSFKD